MELIIIIGVILLISSFFKNTIEDKAEIEIEPIKQNDVKNKLKKVLLGILMFIPLFIVYYFGLAIFGMIILNVFVGPENREWVYSMIFAISVSPICAVISILRILNRGRDK